MSSDESSELSSVPSDTENDLQVSKNNGLLKFFTKAEPRLSPSKDEASRTPPKRDPSPAHEYILADNPDIAFIVMFRSRFTEAFPKSLANFGPQELEQDIAHYAPGEGAEIFLCAILGLLLNRKQDVKPGHYSRALEEAIQSHKSQWAKDWENKNPLSKGATFSSMTPEQRLTLLRTMILWALSSSDAIRGIIQSSYKQQRQEDDLNQPLSVQPWGSDSERRRYYLIEGLFDTQFRVYRESNYMDINRTWWSVASNIDELRYLGERLLTQDGGQKARLLSGKILAAIPRFEAAEEKRKRKEYRTTRKHSLKQPEADYSIYEGRTRGKRVKYTFSDEDEDLDSSIYSSRRSARNNENSMVIKPLAPVVTQSGRQVRSRQGGMYGETVLSKVNASTVGDNDTDQGLILEVKDKLTSKAPAANNNGDFSSEDDDDTNEQDYNDEEETCLDSDSDVPVNFSDEDEDKLDDIDKNHIIKLPTQTPIPEHRTVIKLQLTPEQEKTVAVACSDSKKNTEDKMSIEAQSMKESGGRLLCTSALPADCTVSKKMPNSPSSHNNLKPHSSLAC